MIKIEHEGPETKHQADRLAAALSGVELPEGVSAVLRLAKRAAPVAKTEATPVVSWPRDLTEVRRGR